MPAEVMSAVIVRWEDPPPPLRCPEGGRPPSNGYQEIADALRARPGVWGVVYEGAARGSGSSLAHHIRTGSARAFSPTGDFEARTRDRNGVRTVYARYLGDGEG